MITTKVTIMGTKYKVRIGVSPQKDAGLINRFGYSNPTSKEIVIADMDEIEGWRDESDKSKLSVINTTLRHEIIHVFLYESGLWASSVATDSWAMNEEMVDWISIQFPKILKVLRQFGCEGEV